MISPAQPLNTNDVTKPSSREMSIGTDTFLQLMVAQLRNQDPTSPLDTSTYMAQLAQLSTLEQSVKQSETLERLAASIAMAEATQLVGRHVTSHDTGASGTIVRARLESGRPHVDFGDGAFTPLGSNYTVARA
jgi:flagellar basal-body rod modification protein FlgD